MNLKSDIIDGNEAVARVAHKLNEVIAIYPITPSSNMGELSDYYTSKGERNIFGTVPDVMEMQSEGGASGAVHGALQTGALSTTFTASQGLLLMIPNMYKIAGELTPTVFHVSARAIAAQGLSIFGDHSDVMGVRQTGFALLSSNSVQEAHDFALISQTATLSSRVPFLHFFDGFRTSHEVSKINLIDEQTMKEMIDDDLVIAHRKRALTSDNPVIRGTAQNSDVYFQGRETSNIFYNEVPQKLQTAMDQFEKLTGRAYKLFEYVGDKDATRIIILMGSGAEAVEESVEKLNEAGEKVGVLKIRLYRPFSMSHFIDAIPKSVTSIAVLDRTKEPGSLGEPLYLDVVSALHEAKFSVDNVIGGRYGLSSKEFTPSMIKRVYDELKSDNPKNHFTIGINDDVTHTSLDVLEEFSVIDDDTFQGLFFGLGSDGTVGANKNTIKIIGSQTDNYAQGYFVYDSKKSGSMTTSHLRFGKNPIRSTYLIEKANFIACHQSVFLEKIDILEHAQEGATFLLNTPFDEKIVWKKLPQRVQEQMIEKKINFYAINAYDVAKKSGMGKRINTVMQTCFFAISGILPQDQAIEKIKNAIKKSYGSKGDMIVKLNFKAVDNSVANLHKIELPSEVNSKIAMQPSVKGELTPFVQSITAQLIEGKGDLLPVSQMPNDGTWPTGTTKFEKRNIAHEVPVWDPDVCIQCNKCVFVCPHSVIRSNVVAEKSLKDMPSAFKFVTAKGKNFEADEKFTIQVAVEDCTGCALCVEVCPAKNKSQTNLKAINMQPQMPLREQEVENWDYFTKLPLYDRSKLNHEKLKESQFLEPLFEFSGACPGCGETPYIKLASQLFGDRMIIANATGCSSIYGGNLPTTPWTKNSEGKGPAWANSLFEDNAEFGLGFRLSIDKKRVQAEEILEKIDGVDKKLSSEILSAKERDEADIFEQRERIKELKKVLKKREDSDAKHLLSLADYMSKKSVWTIGGDGWAYDIGYGGLDHVLASGRNVNILVLDTQVYSNTGGQQSKATMVGAVAKFASNGKAQIPKDLAMMAISYGNVYVARIAMGANDTQTLKAFIEAERYDGPSIIIAYAHCIAHGYDLRFGLDQQKRAVDAGLWPLFRYNPDLELEGKNPMILEYKGPKIPVKDFMYNETRFKIVEKINSNDAKTFLDTATYQANTMYERYKGVVDRFKEEEEQL